MNGNGTPTLMESEKITELVKALVAVQAELDNPTKDKKNSHFGNTYADLAGYLTAAMPILSKHGIAVVQRGLPGEPGQVVVETRLLHTSGEWIAGQLAMTPAKDRDPQAVGSTITYARRYLLAAMLGMAAEDDDGNSGAGRNGEKKSKRETRDLPPVGRPPARPRNDEPPDDLEAELQGGGWPEEPPPPRQAPKVEDPATVPAARLPGAYLGAIERLKKAGGDPAVLYPDLKGLAAKKALEVCGGEDGFRATIAAINGEALKLERARGGETGAAGGAPRR